MPPKVLHRNRRSQKVGPEVVPIFQILIDKQQDDPIRSIWKKLDASVRDEPSAPKKSFFVLILKICGLESYVQKISWLEPLQSLSDILQQICEENQNQIVVNELFLINQKSKFHKQFKKRVKMLLSSLICDEGLNQLDDDIMDTFFNPLQCISKCKMRNIRQTSLQLANLIIQRLILFKKELTDDNLTKRASKVINQIDSKYLSKLIKPRLKDVDKQIRQRAFEMITNTFIELMDELLTSKKLSECIIQPMSENKHKIISLCLQSATKIFEALKEKNRRSSNRQLLIFAADILKSLEELVLIPNRNSCLAMDTMLAIHSINPSMNALKPRIIAKVFQIHGYEKFQEGLKKAVYIFFKSLLNFDSQQDLKEHRSMLIVEIIHLLCSINSSKLLSIILKQFFILHPYLFTFDDMFLLLFTQYYSQEGNNIELTQKQLAILSTMISQFNIFLRGLQNSEHWEKESESYNKNVLSNCKQIYYEKIPKYGSICHLYLKIFSLISLPVKENMNPYLQFLEDKILDFVKQERFLTISGDSLLQIQLVLQQSVNVCKLFFRETWKTNRLVESFGVEVLCRKQSLDGIDIFKLSSINANYFIDSINSEGVLMKILQSFSHYNQKVIKFEILSFAYHSHRWVFTQLFQSPSRKLHQKYINLRDVYFDFLVQMVLESRSEDNIVKVAGFNIFCKTLRLVSNSRIADIGAIYFEPNNNQLQILYQFISQYIKFDEGQVSETSMMMANLGLQNQQIKQQIVENIFLVFSDCFRLALSKYSINFLTKVMTTQSTFLHHCVKQLDKLLYELTKLQVANQNNNRFVYWRLYNEVINQLGFQEEELLKKITEKLIQMYFKYKKNHQQTKALLTNKLMLFLADFIDKSCQNEKYINLKAVKMVLSKTNRRFSKETLHRLLIFFQSRSGSIENRYVKDMKSFLAKISKVGKKKKEKSEDSPGDQNSSQGGQSSSKSQSESRKSEEPMENEKNKENVGQNEDSEKKEVINRRSLRNRTKRKY